MKRLVGRCLRVYSGGGIFAFSNPHSHSRLLCETLPLARSAPLSLAFIQAKMYPPPSTYSALHSTLRVFGAESFGAFCGGGQEGATHSARRRLPPQNLMQPLYTPPFNTAIIRILIFLTYLLHGHAQTATPTATPSGSATANQTPSTTATPSRTLSGTPTASRTLSGSPTPDSTGSRTNSPSPTPSNSGSPSASGTQSGAPPSITPSATPSVGAGPATYALWTFDSLPPPSYPCANNASAALLRCAPVAGFPGSTAAYAALELGTMCRGSV
jgi:hypothetical protein